MKEAPYTLRKHKPFQKPIPVIEKAKMEYGEEYLVGGFNIQDVEEPWQGWLPIIAKAWFVNNRAPDTMLTELQTLELVRHCCKGAQTVATRGITSAWITEVWESAC